METIDLIFNILKKIELDSIELGGVRFWINKGKIYETLAYDTAYANWNTKAVHASINTLAGAIVEVSQALSEFLVKSKGRSTF